MDTFEHRTLTIEHLVLNIVHFSTVKVVRCIGAVSIKAVSISTASVRPVVSLNIARKLLLLQGQLHETVNIIHLHSYDNHHLLCGHCLFHYVIAFSICSANSLNIAHKLFFRGPLHFHPFMVAAIIFGIIFFIAIFITFMSNRDLLNECLRLDLLLNPKINQTVTNAIIVIICFQKDDGTNKDS